MQVADNVLARHLEQVFWVSGTACSGKTTVGRVLAERYGLQFYNADENYGAHRELASPEFQPSMCREFPSLRSWFCQPLHEYVQSLEGNLREALDMVMLDAVILSRNGPLIVEGSFHPAWLGNVVPPSRYAFLFAAPDLIRRDFFARKDKQDVYAALNTLPDADAVVAHVLDVVTHSARSWTEGARAQGAAMFERTDEIDVEERVSQIARHFGMDKTR